MPLIMMIYFWNTNHMPYFWAVIVVVLLSALADKR
jgi:hypothetical protein